MEPSHLKALYDNPGPFASVYLVTERADPEAGHPIKQRWRELRGRLAADGADEPTLEAIDAAVGSDRGQPSPYGQAIFAAGAAVLLQEQLRAPTMLDRTAFGPLPDILPLLAQTLDFSSYQLVLADRTGADVQGHAGGGVDERARRAAQVVAAQEEESLRAEALDRYAGRLATGGAVEGLIPTVVALRRGDADTLLISLGSKVLDAWLWWGPEPGQLAAHPEELTDMCSPQTRRDKAGNVLVRAAVQNGSRILVLAGGEPGPANGVGAVLRHT